ncbi:peptidyl-prolyl cis-trans isomerase FKBP8 [Drosophila innubila]|uniref:peptidyl-prolyl cis-trans isomerase FKBP8 n=1 Tax=Drosophila innubila TaxID=198719 RepID=UPI00148D4DC2|nr:peptidyl-prolyl cis-trans isomerase FKBP8 [Drosophila innubila]XP_034480100.1 peptidyl-prolyl cis-trans isomerase FKBP8 [Drosophila innubila]
MDVEKSSSSSFEDLTNAEDTKDIRAAQVATSVADSLAETAAAIKKNVDDNDDNAKTQEVKVEDDDEEAEAEEGECEGEEEIECDILGNKQLIKRIIKKAPVSAQRPNRGDLVTITFTGKLEDGTIVEKEENFQCHVGDYEVIQGLDMVLPMMHVGELAQISVDPRFGYGALGLKKENTTETIVAPNAHLIYDVELLDVKYEDFKDLKSFDILRKYGARKKERANYFYKRVEYNNAIHLYRRALDYLDNRDGDPDAEFDKEDLKLSNSDLQTLLEDRLIVYNNLAMAQIKIGAFDVALQSVEHVLRCQPNNPKALYRKGRVLEGKADTQGAIKLLQKVATLEPDNRAVQSDLARLFIKARREEHNEKEMYQKMLGQAKKMEQTTAVRQKTPLVDNSKLKLLGFLMGTILIGVAGVAIYRYKY